MVCKIVFGNTNKIITKNKTPWSKSKLHNANSKKTKTVTHYGKTNNAVRNKR